MLSNNDGCVVARSNETKALGITMGVPEFQIRSLLQAHHVQVFSSNYRLYGDLSQRVMETLEQFSPDLEIYSIDEAFLSLAGFERRNLTDYGRTIRKTVKQWTGLPVSVGIAETKTLAKLANRIAKRTSDQDGVFDLLACPDREALLNGVAVGDVWGLGRTLRACSRNGASRRPCSCAKRTSLGSENTWAWSACEWSRNSEDSPASPLKTVPAQARDHLLTRLWPIRQYTRRDGRGGVVLCLSCGGEAAGEGLAATVLTVFIMTNAFTEEPQYRNSVTCALPVGTDSTSELIRAALKGLRRIYQDGYRYKKAGVMCTALVPTGQVQPDLFDQHDRPRSKRLMTALDAINDRWGAGTLQYAASGLTKAWKTQCHQRSPAYTTDWDELPVAKA